MLLHDAADKSTSSVLRVLTIPRLQRGRGPTFGMFCISVFFLMAALLMPIGLAWARALCVALCTVGFPLSLLLSRAAKKIDAITVADVGMRKGNLFIPWQAVKKIRWGRWHPSQISIFYRTTKKPPWHKIDLLSLGRLSVFTVATSPEAFSDLIPEILKNRKDLNVSDHVRRVLYDQDRLFQMPVTASLRLLAGIIILALIWLLVWLSAGPLVEIFLFSQLALLCAFQFDVLRLTSEQKFVHDVSIMLTYLQFILLGLVLEIPAFFIEALSVMVMVFLLSALFVAAFKRKLSFPLKAIIVTVAIILPLIVYFGGMKAQLVKKDITDLVGDGWFSAPPFWSSNTDDRCFISEIQEQQCLIRPDMQQARPLLVHYGYQRVRAIDDFSVVRITITQKPSVVTAYLYRRADGTEIKLAAAYDLRVVYQQCLSPSGKLFCFLEYAAEDADPVLKIYDLERQTIIKPFDLPRSPDFNWVSCKWLDDQTLAIEAHESKSEDKRDLRLHVFKADYRRGLTEHFVSPGRFRHWVVSPDVSYAFAQSEDDDIHYVNLITGEQSDLGGDKFPEWTKGGDSALRVKKLNDGRQWLCRFDPRSVVETPIYKIPADTKLQWISPGGKFAILVSKDILRLRPLSLLKLSTGQRQQLDVSIGSRAILDNYFCFEPHITLWSPDERQFLLQTVDIKSKDRFKKISCDFKTCLYSLPDGW